MKKNLIFLFISLLLCFGASAQKKQVQFLQQVDQKLLHFGFTLGMHTQEFQFTPSLVTDEKGVQWYGDAVILIPGFTVGIVTDMRLGEYFNLRSVPTLNFGDRPIMFSGMKNGKQVDEFNTTLISAIISLPLSIKYRAMRVNNYRPYLIAGVGGMVDLSRKKDLTLLLKQYDYFVEFGVGCDYYMPYFKLAPEFKMTIGFNDMLERDRPMIADERELIYTQSIRRLTSRLFTLTFNFE